MSRRTTAFLVSLAVNAIITACLHDAGRLIAMACGVAAGTASLYFQLWLIRELR